jgi:hypothetical protein
MKFMNIITDEQLRVLAAASLFGQVHVTRNRFGEITVDDMPRVAAGALALADALIQAARKQESAQSEAA